MGVLEKLLAIQQELKAPKGQHNNFGNYNFRSCEDILEAVKPIAGKLNCVVILTDTIELIGTRYYVKATACICDVETGEQTENTAYARECAEKKGYDESQITGSASSYARKYALNGLFCIDDTKDADANEYREQPQQPEPGCTQCGWAIKGGKDKAGNYLTPAEVAAKTGGLCMKCFMERKKATGA